MTRHRYIDKSKIHGTTLLCHRNAQTPLGPALVAATSAGEIAFLGFCRKTRAAQEIRALKQNWSLAGVEERPDALAPSVKAIFSVAALPADVPLLLVGTPFQHKVWRGLLRIKPGKTTSYGALAKKLHTAPRALGGAVGANPVSYLVPCHRVLDSAGGLNGYRWGLDIKRQLLRAEGAA